MNTRLDTTQLDKKNWYRMEEREGKKIIPLLMPGQYITFSRSIMRAGYWLQPNDMPWQTAVDECVRVLSDETGMEPEAIRRLLRCLSNYESLPPLHDDECDYMVLRKMMDPIRRAWLSVAKVTEFREDRKELDIRTFWYVDHDPIKARIEDLKRKAVGAYDTASWNDEDGCGSQNYLVVKGYQTLYRLTLPFFWDHSERIYVHPLDVEIIG